MDDKKRNILFSEEQIRERKAAKARRDSFK